MNARRNGSKRAGRALSLKKESLRALGVADLTQVVGGIDVDGSGRAIIIYQPDPAKTNVQVDTGSSR